MIAFHKHRILPGHMGGTYNSKNVIRVNIAMHAFLHKCLYEQHGRWQDKIAWKLLVGLIPHAAAQSTACSEWGKKRWAEDEAFREKIKASHGTPKERARKSANAKAGWKSGGWRERLTASQTVRWADPEQRVAMSKRMKGKQWALGYKHTAEALAKISEASRSQQAAFSEEKKAAIAAKRWATRRRNKVVH